MKGSKVGVPFQISTNFMFNQEDGHQTGGEFIDKKGLQLCTVLNHLHSMNSTTEKRESRFQVAYQHLARHRATRVCNQYVLYLIVM